MIVAVAGAGLGGLAAALSLARHGSRVEVVERAAILSEAGAGVQLSPNAARVLAALGLLDRIAARAVRVSHVAIRRWRDGAEIARVPLGRAAEERYGAPFLVAHRADVQAALLDALIAETRASLTLGERVVSFALAGDGVVLTLGGEGGERTLAADGLVGADGLRSVIRGSLAPHGRDALVFSGRMAWRSLVPAEAVETAQRQPASQLWLGPHAHLVHYPVRGGALINVVAILDGAGSDQAEMEGWSAPGDPGRLAARLRDWSPTAQRLIAAAPDWRVWPLFERPALQSWSSGPATLIGDAAHPMLPFLAQGAAQALEDGWALGRAVGQARCFADAALRYEWARRPVATRVQRESSRQGTVYHLAGPLAGARDAVMRLMGPDRMLARYDWLYGAPAGLPPCLPPMV